MEQFTLNPGQRAAAAEYQIELANKVRHGRAVGNRYVVTRRPSGHSGVVAEFDTREEAEAWIVAQVTP
jgi:hypothetical protein